MNHLNEMLNEANKNVFISEKCFQCFTDSEKSLYDKDQNRPASKYWSDIMGQHFKEIGIVILKSRL